MGHSALSLQHGIRGSLDHEPVVIVHHMETAPFKHPPTSARVQSVWSFQKPQGCDPPLPLQAPRPQEAPSAEHHVPALSSACLQARFHCAASAALFILLWERVWLSC